MRNARFQLGRNGLSGHPPDIGSIGRIGLIRPMEPHACHAFGSVQRFVGKNGRGRAYVRGLQRLFIAGWLSG